MRLQLATNGPLRRSEGSYASAHLKRRTAVEPPTLLTAWDPAAKRMQSRQRRGPCSVTSARPVQWV